MLRSAGARCTRSTHHHCTGITYVEGMHTFWVVMDHNYFFDSRTWLVRGQGVFFLNISEKECPTIK